jgi:hypothetical protein
MASPSYDKLLPAQVFIATVLLELDLTVLAGSAQEEMNLASAVRFILILVIWAALSAFAHP